MGTREVGPAGHAVGITWLKSRWSPQTRLEGEVSQGEGRRPRPRSCEPPEGEVKGACPVTGAGSSGAQRSCVALTGWEQATLGHCLP